MSGAFGDYRVSGGPGGPPGGPGHLTAKGEPPENRLVVAALLFFTYESLAMHLQDAEDYLTPLIEMGRFTRQGDRLMLPYAITANHAAADGYHVHQFYAGLQADLDQLDWMDA